MAFKGYFITLQVVAVIVVPFVCVKCIIQCQRRRERLRREAELALEASRRNTAQNFAVRPFKYAAAPHRRPQGDDREAPPDDRSASTVPECVICLSKVADGEVVKVLPICAHMFHVDCIDMWLFAHHTCPVCRSPVAPPPPPSSVVPVAS